MLAALVLLALVPAANVVMRLLFGGGLAVTTEYVRHLTLWVALLAGIITTRQGAHLALSSGLHKLPGPWGGRMRAAASAISVAVTTALAASALSLLLLAFDPRQRVGAVPIQAAVAILPAGFAAIAARFAAAAFRQRCGRLAVLAAVPAGLLLGSEPLVNSLQAVAPAYFPSYDLAQAVAAAATALRLPLLLALVAAAFIGVPIFVLLSGVTLLQDEDGDAYLSSPLAAAAFQWFGLAPHMNDLRLAPLYGALVISKRVWERIPERIRPRLRAVAQAAGERLSASAHEQDDLAVHVMRAHGLQVYEATAALEQEWQDTVRREFQGLIGAVIDPAAYQLVTDTVAAYRARAATAD